MPYYIIQHKIGLTSNYQYSHFKFMLMNDLLQTRIFELLFETSQEVTNEEMQVAYGEFLEQIKNISDGIDYSVIYRTLNATRIEIASLETTPFYGMGGKCA